MSSPASKRRSSSSAEMVADFFFMSCSADGDDTDGDDTDAVFAEGVDAGPDSSLEFGDEGKPFPNPCVVPNPCLLPILLFPI